MFAEIAANAIVLFHLAFIVFVAIGGFLVLKWPKIAWIHLPVVLWGAMIEFAGWTCPLTPLENKLRFASGSYRYLSGFIDHYIVPVVYPPGLTRGMQLALGAAVITINAIVYGIFVVRRSSRKRKND